jgi:hypothetical protein
MPQHCLPCLKLTPCPVTVYRCSPYPSVLCDAGRASRTHPKAARRDSFACFLAPTSLQLWKASLRVQSLEDADGGVMLPIMDSAVREEDANVGLGGRTLKTEGVGAWAGGGGHVGF